MSASGHDEEGSRGKTVATTEPVGFDPYRELGVEPTVDLKRLRRAYHAKARQLHPDLGGDPTAMARLNLAYELLRDPARRRQHDAARPKPARPPRDVPPPWTGAAGPPPGKPSGPVLDFGIFAGWSIGEIARHDPGYLDWLAARSDGRPYLAAIERFLAPIRAAGGGPDPRSGPRPERARWQR